MRAVVLVATLALACSSSQQSAQRSAPAPSQEARVKTPHPVLGQAVRLEVHRFRPDATFTVTAAERIAEFTAAISPAKEPAASVPRTQPKEEIVFFDAAGASLGAAVFLDPDAPSFVSVRDAGTRELTAAEAKALRALLAEVK